MAFLKNRDFGKNRVSNLTKSSSIFSGFFRVLLLPCEKDEKLREEESYHGILPGSHQDSGVRTCWRPTHSKLLSTQPTSSVRNSPAQWSTAHFWHHASKDHTVLSAVKPIFFF